MFRFTHEPSSGSQSQCLAKNYRYGSTVLVDMNVVSVMAAYSDLLYVCVWFTVQEGTTVTSCTVNQDVARRSQATSFIPNT
jgi:hypothetical protein